MVSKLLVVCGPTATGKTELGVRLAKKFNGEIISADSRQVYKGMDVITGKDIEVNSKLKTPCLAGRQENLKLNITNPKFDVGYRLKDDIPVWLVDVVEPDYLFNAGEYGMLAQKVINDIWSRNKLPIVVGGTGFYIKTIIDPFDTYMIPPNKLLRKELEQLSLDILQERIIKEDPERWNSMNESDSKNPRRLIRALEVSEWKKRHQQKFSVVKIIDPEKILLIGLRTDFKNVLRERINTRIEKRATEGAIEEVKRLMDKKHSRFLPSLTTTGASELIKYIEKKQTLKEAIISWQYRETFYAKRQITWFRKEKKIKWFDVNFSDYPEKIEEIVSKWYTAK